MAPPADYLRRKLQLLEDQIAQIDHQLHERQHLAEHRLAELQQYLDRLITAKTNRTLLTDLTGQPDYTKALGQLQNLIRETQTQLAQERIGSWRDMQQLRRERRQVELEAAKLRYKF